jgi:hypothetical protein
MWYWQLSRYETILTTEIRYVTATVGQKVFLAKIFELCYDILRSLGQESSHALEVKGHLQCENQYVKSKKY